MTKQKLKILFLCTGNSCRSQMAEGFTRYMKEDLIEPYSAGIEPHGLDPYAIKVMAEASVDISNHRSKHFSELKNIDFDYVVTVCDDAHEKCPVYPGKTKTIHLAFDDPPRLAKRAATEQEKFEIYHRIRDEIREFIKRLPDVLSNSVH